MYAPGRRPEAEPRLKYVAFQPERHLPAPKKDKAPHRGSHWIRRPCESTQWFYFIVFRCLGFFFFCNCYNIA